MTRTHLVGELERLYRRQFGHGEVVGAGWVGAREIYDLLGRRAQDAANGADFTGEVGDDAALKATGTDDAPAGSWVRRVRFGRESEEVRADGERDEAAKARCGGVLCGLLEAFELDAACFALGLCRPHLADGVVQFRSGNDKLAEKRLDALKDLAARLDCVEAGLYCDDVHGIFEGYRLARVCDYFDTDRELGIISQMSASNTVKLDERERAGRGGGYGA